MTAEEYINRAKREDYPGGHLTYTLSVDDALEAVKLAREENKELSHGIAETTVSNTPKVDWKQVEIEERRYGMKIDIGEYEIPDECRAKVYGGKVYIYQRRNGRGRPKSTRVHCKDCKHRVLGYACNNICKTNVCELRPKTSTTGGKRLYYAVSKYGAVCDKFESNSQNNINFINR